MNKKKLLSNLFGFLSFFFRGLLLFRQTMNTNSEQYRIGKKNSMGLQINRLYNIPTGWLVVVFFSIYRIEKLEIFRMHTNTTHYFVNARNSRHSKKDMFCYSKRI